MIKEIPSLRKHGISETSIRYLFNPVNKGTFTAARYKRQDVIDATVPCKDNSPRKGNLDTRYLLSRIKLRREMAAYFPVEIAIVSADSMNRIHYGTLAVSRYHQVRKIFMNSDKPKYLDHDFPLPYKTIPDGIMILSNNKDDDNLFLHDDVVIDETARYNTSQELQEKVITIENQTDRINNALYQAAHTLKDEANVFGIISRQLPAIGFLNLTKEKLEEETKAKLDDSSNLYTISKFIGETYDVKFIMYNGAKLPPVSVIFSSCPTFTATFAIYCKESKWHTYEIEGISDEQFLQTFADVESGKTLADENESITMINDESGREYVKYPHTGSSIVYL